MIKTICPKCKKYPFIEILSQDDFGKIKVNCNCGFSNNFSIDDYIVLAKEKNAKIFVICNKHKKIYKEYCIECKEHLCDECAHINKSHSIVNLEDYKSEFDHDKIQNKIKECEATLNTTITELMSKCKTIYLNKINELEDAYKRTMHLNTSLLQLYKSILNYYDPKYPNYILLKNIVKNNTLHCEPYTQNFNKFNHPSSMFNFIKTFKVFHCINLEGISNIMTYPPKTLPSLYYALILKDGRLLLVKDGYHRSVNPFYVYNPNQNYKQELILPGHMQPVKTIGHFNEKQIYSVTIQGEFKLWTINKNSYTCDYNKKMSGCVLYSFLLLPHDRMAFAIKSNRPIINIYSTLLPFSIITTINIEHNVYQFDSCCVHKRNLFVGYYFKNVDHCGYIDIYSLEKYQILTSFFFKVGSLNVRTIKDDDYLMICTKHNNYLLNLEKMIMEVVLENCNYMESRYMKIGKEVLLDYIAGWRLKVREVNIEKYTSRDIINIEDGYIGYIPLVIEDYCLVVMSTKNDLLIVD